MPFGASAVNILSERQPASQRLVVNNATLTTLLNRVAIRTIVEQLRTTGRFDCQLPNGLSARLFLEGRRSEGRLTVVYLGLAIRDPLSQQYITQARVVFSEQMFKRERFLAGAYGLIEEVEPSNTCPQLLANKTTPVMVSDALKSGYRGVGTALINVLKGLAAAEGFVGIKILLSLVDDFYVDKCQFSAGHDGRLEYRFNTTESLGNQCLDSIQARPGLSADWFPVEATITPSVTGRPIIIASQTRYSLMQRLQAFFLRTTAAPLTAE